MDRTGTFTVQPNPVLDVANLRFEAKAVENVRIYITDARGAVVYNLPFKTSPGLNVLPIDMSAYSRGVYSVSIRGTDMLQTIQVVKQ